jgi:hypothetical protein
MQAKNGVRVKLPRLLVKRSNTLAEDLRRLRKR